MASRKDNRKDEPATAKAEEPSSFSQQQKEEEIREAIVDAFDEAKDNTQKAVKEARKEIPRYTEAINNYQEQTLEAVREIAENYIESQKEIINSFQQSTWVSQIGNAYQTFWSNCSVRNWIIFVYYSLEYFLTYHLRLFYVLILLESLSFELSV
jgi:hypothetical protein